MNDLLWLGSMVARMSLLSRALREVHPVSPAQMVGEAVLAQNKNCVKFSFLVHLDRATEWECEGFHPVLVVSVRRPSSNGADAVHVAREMDDVLRTSEQWEVAMDGDMIETLASHATSVSMPSVNIRQMRDTRHLVDLRGHYCGSTWARYFARRFSISG